MCNVTVGFAAIYVMLTAFTQVWFAICKLVFHKGYLHRCIYVKQTQCVHIKCVGITWPIHLNTLIEHTLSLNALIEQSPQNKGWITAGLLVDYSAYISYCNDCINFTKVLMYLCITVYGPWKIKRALRVISKKIWNILLIDTDESVI